MRWREPLAGPPWPSPRCASLCSTPFVGLPDGGHRRAGRRKSVPCRRRRRLPWCFHPRPVVRTLLQLEHCGDAVGAPADCRCADAQRRKLRRRDGPDTAAACSEVRGGRGSRSRSPIGDSLPGVRATGAPLPRQASAAVERCDGGARRSLAPVDALQKRRGEPRSDRGVSALGAPAARPPFRLARLRSRGRDGYRGFRRRRSRRSDSACA
jgi:hypothetical protein